MWDDAGTGGRPGSMWVVNSLGLIHVCEGHNAPTEKFYDLYKVKFMANENIGAMNFGNQVVVEEEEMLPPGGEARGSTRFVCCGGLFFCVLLEKERVRARERGKERRARKEVRKEE